MAVKKIWERLRGLPKVTLTRIIEGDCTAGTLKMPSGNTLFTIEPPWRNNSMNVSCIPKGVYLCTRSRYNRGGYDTFEVHVDDRTHIKFHIGNDLKDTQGCPLVNDKIGADHNRIRGVESRRAFKEFYREMSKYDEFMLEVL